MMCVERFDSSHGHATWNRKVYTFCVDKVWVHLYTFAPFGVRALPCVEACVGGRSANSCVVNRMAKRKAEHDDSEVLRLKLQIADMREEIRSLKAVNAELQEAQKESSRIFMKLKPTRPPISSEKKLLIAGEQHFCCAAPHGKDKCPMWLLHDGNFGIFGWEVDHVTPWCKGHRNAGNLAAICHACHGLKCRLERIAALESKGEEDDDEDV